MWHNDDETEIDDNVDKDLKKDGDTVLWACRGIIILVTWLTIVYSIQHW